MWTGFFVYSTYMGGVQLKQRSFTTNNTNEQWKFYYECHKQRLVSALAMRAIRVICVPSFSDLASLG